MLTTGSNRLDPSLLRPEELEPLSRLFANPGHILLTDSKGNQAEIPKLLFDHLVRVVQLMSERKAVVILPEDELFTTQAAANYLGVSRQFLVNLLEKGEIPFRRVGSHRRVSFKDILGYERSRDVRRRETLDCLNDRVISAGLYASESPEGTAPA
jgi:excisionase family DNA binding protein